MSTPLVFLARAGELPAGEDWLAPAERATLHRFRAPKRRRDFRLGRFAAQQAMVSLDRHDGILASRGLEVRPLPGGAPRAFRDGAPLAVAISISHSEGWAAAAVCRGTARLGCDLECIEARSSAFLGDYLRPSEHAFVWEGPESKHALRATLLWSAKEAVMKALAEGLRLAPASVEILPLHPAPSDAGWRGFSIRAPRSATHLRGFWRTVGPFVLTVAGGALEPRLTGPSPEDPPRWAST